MGLYDINFSNNLRKYRINAGYTQSELAKKLGMTRQNYIRYENETIKAQPSIELLCKLADILNTDVKCLIGYKSSIDLETAYKMFNVTIRKNKVYFVYNVTLHNHDELGFNTEPTEKEITIIIPKNEFDEMLLNDYRIAYQHVTKTTDYNITSYFTATVKSDVYNFFLTNLLNKVCKE